MNDARLINKNMGRSGMRNMNNSYANSNQARNNSQCNSCQRNIQRQSNSQRRMSQNNRSNSDISKTDMRNPACMDCDRNNENRMPDTMRMDQKRCMQNIYELGFVITESILYLDTHPDDTEAIEYYSQMRDEFLKMMDYYAENFGPLNYFNIESKNYWTWVSTPMPWEVQ